jgi:hypothetical protein
MELPANASPQDKLAAQNAGACVRNPPTVVAMLQPMKPSPANPQGVGYSVQGIFPPVSGQHGCFQWAKRLMVTS